MNTTGLINLIKVSTVTCGNVRIEGRAPSHDGEYLTVITIADDFWFATGSGGVVTGSEDHWFEGDAYMPGFDELALASETATDGWDFLATPEQYGYEARDLVQMWLDDSMRRIA